MRSDKLFSDFIKRGSVSKKIVLGAVGILLIILSFAFASGKDAEPSVSEEDRLASLCSEISGAGECYAFITYKEDGGYFSSGEAYVYSVAVVCDGAESARVRSEIKELVSSLYGIGTNRIAVVCKKN